MALFSCPISVVQRSAGQCAVSAAAYAARTKLNWYPRDKEINLKGTISWDYSHLPGLAYSKIHAPDGTPSWVFDREELWNKAEDAEIRHDAQTARKFIIALQVELTLEQNIALIEDVVSELVAMGMVVDANIHTDKPHNPHAHLLATTRELKENRYGEMEFSRLKTREWGSKDFIRATRAMVADKINDHLKLAGFDVTVTHESYKTLGIDLEPTRHEGPARNIKNSELVALNKEIYARNAEKIRENPSLVLDKLAINKPVFTCDEIAIEIEKVLSHEMIDTLETITNSSKKASKVSPDLESLNQDMTSKYMEIYTKIMRSPELSLVTGGDLKGRTLYTTTKRLEMEQRYVANVENLNNSNAHRLSLRESDLDQLSLKETIADATLKIVTDLAQALENKTGIKFSLPEQSRSLSDEQRAAVLNILNGPDIGVIEGIPGAGKTVAMQEIVRQSQKAGKTVIGVTPSSAAALVLGKETGIECKNASLWRKEWLKAKGEKFDVILRGDYYKEDMYKGEGSTNILSGLFAPKGLTKDHVMIIDEASMMELAGMDYLLSEAARVGAKVIKVGDNNQLHAVGWLGAFKKTIDICGSHRLEEARRQQNPLHQRATKLLGSYKIRDALKIYLDEGSIIIEKGEAQSRAHLLKDYLESYIENSKILDRDDIATSRTQVISTYTNAAAAKLNVEVRRSLRDAGIIKGKQYKINVGDKTINLAKGEQIVFTRNYNHLGRAGIYNGEVGTVVSVSKPDEYGHSLVAIMVSKADGGKEGVIIDTRKHIKHGLSRLFDYGYAVTAHKLQGASVDLNFVHCETNMGYEAINVLFTRHRESLKLYANAEMLKDVLYASLDKDINKAKLRYDILGGEQILGGLVKLASRRVNSSFAGDYAGIGLSDNDKHLATYIQTVHKAALLIKEIGSWQSQEYRRTGVKPDLWDHELWPEFQKTKTDRNEYALYITKNYPAFQDRIVEHSMNYATIEKHASSKEIDYAINYGVVEEHKSILNLSESYKMLVESINELDVRGISKVYRNIKSEIAANYEKVEKAISQRDELIDQAEELKSEIGNESYYRNVLFSEYLTRIYKGSPADIIEKYNLLSEKHGAEKASAMAGNSAQMLGSLKGTGIGGLLGFNKSRRDAVANSSMLEKSLLAYSRSNEIEKEYKMQLEQHNYGLQIQKLDEEIEALRSQLPCDIDDKFLDEVGSSLTGSKAARNKALVQLKSSTLFEAIKVGIYREDVAQDRKMLDREMLDSKILDREDKSNDTVSFDETDKGNQTTDKTTTYKYNASLKYHKQDLPLLRYEDVRGALNPTIIESIFREYSAKLNPDGQIKKQGMQITCGSLNINLSKGLWYRFSDGSKGDIFTLVGEATGSSKRDALEIVAGFAGVQSSNSSSMNNNFDHISRKQSNLAQDLTKELVKEPTGATKNATKPLDAWIAYDIVPYDAPTFNPEKDLSFIIEKGLEVTNIYEYKDAEGSLAGYTVRVIDRVTREKQVLPVAYCMNAAKQESRWQLKGFQTNGCKPIYKTEVLTEKPTARVLIVEGEKTADKAAILFPEYAVISWMGGVGSIGKINWSELADREVVVWPDNDQPGKIAANKIIEEIDKVNGFSGLAKKIDTEFLELEAKWDLGDELPAHLPQEAVQKIIRATFNAPYKTSQLLGEGIANTKTQEKALEALEMLIATGRIDQEAVPSKAIYKSTLAAIAISKGIDLEKSETFEGDVRDLQDTYQNMRNNHERSISLQQTSIAVDKPTDKKTILASELVRDASILHQVILNVTELPKLHSELISDVAKVSVSNLTRFNDIDKEQGGCRMHVEITSTKFVENLELKNQELVASAKINNHNKKVSNIASSIVGYEAHLEKLEKLGFGISLETLKKELQEIPRNNHDEYISSRIKNALDAYMSDSRQKTNALWSAKNDATTISEMMNIMISQQKYKLEVYENYKDLSLEDHKANIGDRSDDLVKTDQLHQIDQADQHKPTDKQKTTDRYKITDQHKIKDYIYGLERACSANQEIMEALGGLGAAATDVEKAGLLSTKEILTQIRGAKTIDDVYNAASNLSMPVELRDISNRLGGFKKHLNKSKTSGDVSSTLKTLEAQQKYLASLHETLSPSHDPHLLVKVEAAHHAEQDNVMDKLQKSIIYAQKHNILSDAEIINRLLDTSSHTSNHAVNNTTNNISKQSPGAPSAIASAESEMSSICIHHNGKIMHAHLKAIDAGQMVKFENHIFLEPKEYLQHWKQTRDHHLIPIQLINKSLTQIRQMEKEHEMGGPSL